MKLTIEAISDKGKVRRNNEDMILLDSDFIRDNEKNRELEVNHEKPLLFALADGMGGHNGGEIASELVLKNMQALVHAIPEGLDETDLEACLSLFANEVNHSILEYGRDNLKYVGLGTTFTGIVFYESRTYVIHAGDSRLYHYHEGELTQLTKDHSAREMMHDPSIPPNILVNIFGRRDDFFADIFTLTNKLISGDTLLLCSDGLTNELSDKEIGELLAFNNAARQLVEAANEKGGNDNVSVAVMKLLKQ